MSFFFFLVISFCVCFGLTWWAPNINVERKKCGQFCSISFFVCELLINDIIFWLFYNVGLGMLWVGLALKQQRSPYNTCFAFCFCFAFWFGFALGWFDFLTEQQRTPYETLMFFRIFEILGVGLLWADLGFATRYQPGTKEIWTSLSHPFFDALANFSFRSLIDLS